MPVKCINARNGTIYRSEERDMDKVWYDETQKSFGKAVQEKNLCERNKAVKAARKWTLKRRNSDPWTFIQEGDQMNDTTEAHHLIQEVIMKEEEKAPPLDSDFLLLGNAHRKPP